MPLGLAKDSMINLAEMANQKVTVESEVIGDSSKINLEYGQEETLVMRLSTHEIETLEVDDEGLLNATESGKEKEKEDSFPVYVDAHAGPVDSTIGERDSVNSDTASQLAHDVANAMGTEPTGAASRAVSPSVNGTSYGSYEGFSTNYSEYESYGGTPAVLGYKQAQNQQSLWFCLFPWLKSENSRELEEDASSRDASSATGKESLVKLDGNRSLSGPPSRSASDDEISTGSDVFGEKLSDKDRQAVLARLRLAQPDKSSSSSPEEGALSVGTKAQLKGLLNGIVPPTGKKGILKRTSTVSRINLSRMNETSAVSSNSSNEGKKQRRSLFPSYETVNKEKQNLHTEFSPMARVLTVKSHKDMDGDEKGNIWWQRSDYEEFRKTGRMITRAMLEGGSEIWLATNQSWLLPNRDRQSTLKHAYSLAERQAAFKKGDMKAKKEYEAARDKWWHMFGHSRRGLEHIASIDEGRQRQGNVRTAIRSVVDEQRRQKVFHREDPDKIRMVSLQHTSWARDLAMAAAASDADAVHMNFNDESRKSREFYLLKFSRSNPMTSNSTKTVSVPAFMKPALTMKVQPSRLDANTLTQVRYRQAQKKRASVAPAPQSKESTVETLPLRSDTDSNRSSSMAKEAAGFASGESITDMSAVLSGMGPITVSGGS